LWTFPSAIVISNKNYFRYLKNEWKNNFDVKVEFLSSDQFSDFILIKPKRKLNKCQNESLPGSDYNRVPFWSVKKQSFDVLRVILKRTLLRMCIQTRVARFFLVQTYQNGKIYQMTTIPKGCKLYHMAVKYSKRSQNITKYSIPRPSNFYPK
jgi:hypothetical protein